MQKENKVCKYCYGKGYYTRCYDEVGAEDFGGDGYVKKAQIEKVPCPKCTTGNARKVLRDIFGEPKTEEVSDEEENKFYNEMQREVIQEEENKCEHQWTDKHYSCMICGASRITETKVPSEGGTRYNWRKEMRSDSFSTDQECESKVDSDVLYLSDAIRICEKALESQSHDHEILVNTILQKKKKELESQKKEYEEKLKLTNKMVDILIEVIEEYQSGLAPGTYDEETGKACRMEIIEKKDKHIASLIKRIEEKEERIAKLEKKVKSMWPIFRTLKEFNESPY